MAATLLLAGVSLTSPLRSMPPAGGSLVSPLRSMPLAGGSLVSPLRSVPLMVADGDFCRGSDLLTLGRLTGKTVTARQVANVLGRWTTHEDWDTIGRAGKMDDVGSGDYYEEDVKEVMTDYSKGKEYYIARRPQRREFCQRQGLVQRWVLRDNVGMLPFTDEALAASVGATAAELDAEPISPLAVDVVFDALTSSMSDMVPTEQCDARRASFVTPGGGFDADGFGGALGRARVTIVSALALFPGFFVFVGAVLAWKIDALGLALGWAAAFDGGVRENWEESGPATLVLPALIALVLTQGKSYGGLEEASIKAQDGLYLERKARKKRGDEAEVQPRGSRSARGLKDGKPSMLYPSIVAYKKAAARDGE